MEMRSDFVLMANKVQRFELNLENFYPLYGILFELIVLLFENKDEI